LVVIQHGFTGILLKMRLLIHAGSSVVMFGVILLW